MFRCLCTECRGARTTRTTYYRHVHDPQISLSRGQLEEVPAPDDEESTSDENAQADYDAIPPAHPSHLNAAPLRPSAQAAPALGAESDDEVEPSVIRLLAGAKRGFRRFEMIVHVRTPQLWSWL
jgi:hypothetical protein